MTSMRKWMRKIMTLIKECRIPIKLSYWPTAHTIAFVWQKSAHSFTLFLGHEATTRVAPCTSYCSPSCPSPLPISRPSFLAGESIRQPKGDARRCRIRRGRRSGRGRPPPLQTSADEDERTASDRLPPLEQESADEGERSAAGATR